MRYKFDPNEIVPGLTGIVTLSHGPLAMAMLESVSMLSTGGAAQNSAAFCLDEGDDLDEYREAFVEAIKAFGGDCLIFVDIFGGSPSNQVLLASQLYPDLGKLHVIGGMNLGTVLDAVLLREQMSLEELMEQVFEDSQFSIVNMTEAISHLDDDSSDVTDDEDDEEDVMAG